MKNLKFIFAALLSIAALSCNKLESPVENSESNQDAEMVPLTLSTGVPTKTYIAENGTDIYWHSGDMIKVYSNYIISGILGNDASDYDFTMSGEPQGNFARFTGQVRQGTKKVWAVYPSALAKGANTEGVINVNLPNTQTASENSFSQNLNISVAKTDVTMESGLQDKEPVASGKVAFHNACALLKFVVPSNVTNIKSVVISADQNIAGNMTINYSGDSPVFSSVSGSNAITMEGTFTADKDYYFVLAPVAISELSIFVNTTDNKQYAATKTFSTPLQLNAGEYKSIGTLNLANMPSFEVDFDIQDEGGFLNGTDVIFSFPSDNISNLDLTVTKKGGSVVRTIKVDGPVALNEYNQYISSYTNETVSTWPYLPKGEYIVSGSYTTEAGNVTVSNLVLNINSDPNFTVGSFDAYTSYTKYTSGTNTAVADANACDGASIYVTASNVGISENILKNTNYKDLLQVQFVAPASGYGVANLTNGLIATLTNQQYGEYKSPSYVFDGKAVTFSKISCHVTGIPYALSKNGNDSINKWQGQGSGDVFSWTGGNGMTLGPLTGAITVRKIFSIPSNINVSVSTSGSGTSAALRTKTGTINVGTTKIVSVDIRGFSSKDFNETNVASQFTPTNNYAQVALSDATSIGFTVSKLIINYK